MDTYFEGSIEATVAALIRVDRKKLTEAEYGRLIELIREAEKEKGPMILERWLNLLGAAAVTLVRGLVVSRRPSPLRLVQEAVRGGPHLVWLGVIARGPVLIGNGRKTRGGPTMNEAPVWRRTCGTSPGWMRAAAFRKWSAATCGYRYSAL